MAKSKRTYTGGTASLKARGLVGIVVPVRPEDRDAIRVAAALRKQTATQFAAEILTESARKLLSQHDLKFS